MNAIALLRPALIVVAISSALLAVRFTILPRAVAVLAPAAAVERRTGAGTSTQPTNADSLARVVAARDVFRAGRRPSQVPFNPLTADQNAPPPPAIVIPPLRLAGILAGSDTAALVDGVPGNDATRVLRMGDRIGEFTVRLITADRVVIAGRDTTWTLRLRVP